jgi:hypothetical protein
MSVLITGGGSIQAKPILTYRNSMVSKKYELELGFCHEEVKVMLGLHARWFGPSMTHEF